MADAERRFTVIEGGTGGRVHGALIDTGVVDEHGNSYLKGSPAHKLRNDGGSVGEGGGAMRITLPDLRWNVAILNGLAGLFSFALVGMFLWMVDRIDDRFKEADHKITAISDKVSDLRVEIAGQRGDIKTILEKLDAKPQGSPPER